MRVASFEDKVSVLRVIKVSEPEVINFPLQDRLNRIRDGRSQAPVEELDDVFPEEAQDAKPVRKPEPSDEVEPKVRGEPSDPFSKNPGKRAVYNPGWLAFMKHVDGKEGWYEFAECWVEIENYTETFCDPGAKLNKESFPFRTTCCKYDDGWYVMEENLKIDPPTESLKKEIEDVLVVDTLVSIFSKEPIDQCQSRDAPAPSGGEKEGDDLIEVINVKTGETEKISKADSRYYSADGFKTRRYKNSSKPMDIPSFVWQSMSLKARKEAIQKEQKKIALREAASGKKGKPSIVATPFVEEESESHPIMPTCNQTPQHREKITPPNHVPDLRLVNSLVARPVNKREIRANPKAQEALDLEWNKLVKKDAWLYDTVTEWKEVSNKAKKSGEKVHVGKVFEICVEKGSELPEGDKLRKFKGRTVFQGNNVRDENADVALFSELGSSPATMEAGKSVDAYGTQPGFVVQQNDGVQAYTQATMRGVDTWVEIPNDRWPKEWKGKYSRPVVKLRIALYGHPDSGGLWEQHCESQLKAVGFIMPDPEGWPSVFFHPVLKLLLVVYVDDFKMSGPKESMKKGWELIGSKIDMDTPTEANRYLGCDHVVSQNVKLDKTDHPFAHLFDKSMPDPAAKAAAPARRTQDYWETDPKVGVFIRHHCQPRKSFYAPDNEITKYCKMQPSRCTVRSSNDEIPEWDVYRNADGEPLPGKRTDNTWVGSTYLFSESCKDPKMAMASIKRDKLAAKKRAQGFSYMDELFQNQPCMNKPVNVMTYDMKPFLESCVKRYVELAGKDAKPLKTVSTPCHDERIARPIADESETKGVLAPIATRVLMKILFAARMARFDLLRAVQGLAARVTKWSTECDKALHRLVCYIHSTLDLKLRAFIGDSISDCKLWCFADADHAGEYDNRSTTGCVLVLVGPNSYFPLTAFSKKQTSVSMSSTEAEVVAANITLRAVGLPSSGLWAYLQNAGGDESIPGGLPCMKVECSASVKGDKWIFDPSRRILMIERSKTRQQPLFDPKSDPKIPINIKCLGSARTSIMVIKGKVDFVQDNWRKRGEYPTQSEWVGITCFRVYGPYEADLGIEACEVREALTDYDFIGNERSGDTLLNLIPPKSIQGVFVEDNQATIRILENGKSPTFRHTDKTQRVNLSWLEEQFRRKWYRLVHGPSMMQAADILTKPFTNAEKWKFAVHLLGHSDGKNNGKTNKSNPHSKSQVSHALPAASDESSGEPAVGPKPSRLIVEVCCSKNSKLSDCSRSKSKGCLVYQFTEENNLLSEDNRREIARKVNQFPKSKLVLIWLSLPCTGGTTWTFINLKHPKARRRVSSEIRKLWKIWAAMLDFILMIDREFEIAMEWPTGCRYWKSPKVKKFLEEYQMEKYNFHGCMLGTCSRDGIPIKKPWTVATTIPELGSSLMKYQCDGSHEHAEGRGVDLKLTELYTWKFVDEVHSSLQPRSAASRIALPCVRSVNMTTSGQSSKTNYVPSSQEDADQIVAEMDKGSRPSVHERIKFWERKMIEIRVGALATTFDDSTEGVQMLGGSQQPLVDLVETTVTTDAEHTFYSYPDFVDLLRKVPPYYFGVAECRSEDLVDLLVLGDSTTALVSKPGSLEESTRIPMGDLLQNIEMPGIGNVYSRLCWGRGLNTIVQTAREAVNQIALDNFYAGHPGRKILILLGWSGGDVHGDFGYQGCTWIHQSRYLKSDADRKVAAEWPSKQKAARVDKAIHDLVDLKADDNVYDVVVFGNGHHQEYGLPPSYNKALGGHFQELVNLGVNAVSFELVAMRGFRYDRIHLDDGASNRNLVVRYLKGIVTFHRAYRMVMLNQEVLLETASRLCGSDLELRLHYVHTTPNMLQFRRALEKHEEVKTYLELNAQQTHASQAADCDAQDKEILDWIQAAWAEAEEEATREGAPMGELFSQVELTSCMPVDLGDEDSDCEAERLRINLSEEIEEAVKQGFSIVDSEEVVMNPPDDSAFDEVDLSKWETVPERGVENEFDKISLTTEESIILNDEENIEEVESFTQGSVTLKARDDTTMTEEAEAQEIKQEEQKHAGRPAEKPSGSIPTRPKDLPKDDAAAEKLQQATERDEEKVWLDPNDLAGRIPYKNVNNSGRLLQISKKLSYFLRGHPMEYNLPCPSFNYLDLSVEWEELMTFMRGKIWELEDWEVLQVVRSSDSRRFQIQVAKPGGEKATWKGLPWIPVACRTFQGHNRALLKEAKISSLVKCLYTLDPDFTPERLDEIPPSWPQFNFEPKNSPMFEQFPRVLYHSCDLAHVDNILQDGLIPGGWPKSSGRPHNYFITMPPWSANMRKLAGTRAGKPMYIAFDLELMMQHGCRVFQTDQAVLCSDWVPNECIICVYDAQMRDFYHINRGYPACRKQCNEKIKGYKAGEPVFVQSLLTDLNAMVDKNFDFFASEFGRGTLKSFPNTQREVTDVFKESEARHGVKQGHVQGYMRAPFMGVSFVPQMRSKASRKGWSKGKGKRKNVRDYDIDRSECVVAPNLKVPSFACKNCGHENMDGHHHCSKCRIHLEEHSDIRLATEIARLESYAKESYGIFALDQVTTIQPRGQRTRPSAESSSRASGEPRRGGRSNYGILRDAAVGYKRKMIKSNYESLTDRLELDPFFQFNAAQNQLTPPCLEFIERLAIAISPDFSRSRDARSGGKGTEVQTRLVFMPFAKRQIDHEIDVTYESAIAHHGRFFTLSQFSVYAGTIMNARGEPSPIVHGWSEMNMAVDLTPELNLADLTNFAKDQWAFAFDQKGNEFSNKPYAVATVEKDLPNAFSVVLHDTLERAKHREFEPKRQQWLQKSSSQKGTGWEGYKGIGQGKGKGHSGKGSYQRQTKGTGHWGSNQPYWQQSQDDQWYWNHRHQQYQRSYPGGSAGKGYGPSSSSSHGGYHSKGRSERPPEEAVEWHGAMYTKYTYSDGRIQWMAW